jgi:hypothetical protein
MTGETSRVLEAGFGTGLAIAQAEKVVTRGHVDCLHLAMDVVGELYYPDLAGAKDANREARVLA